MRMQHVLYGGLFSKKYDQFYTLMKLIHFIAITVTVLHIKYIL